MTKFFTFITKSASILMLLFFVVTRLYIWVDRPTEFSEIIYSYMPYAHLWAGGTMPYLEQWYEYPPLTIPLFYLPHWLDRVTQGTVIDLNYLQAYRGELLLIDTAVFALVWYGLTQLKVKKSIRWVALVYYCLVTAKAHDFIYDTMDWTFAGGMVLSVVPLVSAVALEKWARVRSFAGSFQVWLGYWAAVALKLLNGPLGLPLAILKSKTWPTHWLAMLIAGGLVWGIPVVLFRSSLQVMLLFHDMRGLQVDSLGGIVVRVIDSFTHSEQVIEIYKNYEMTGPVTTSVLHILELVFPIALVGFITWMTWQAWRLRDRVKDHQVFMISLTLGYVLLLMLVSKVLSRPFVLWHVPLLALMPFGTVRKQLQFLVPSALALSVTMTAIPDFPLGPFRTSLWVGIIRTVCFIFLFIWWWRWHHQHFSKGK